VGGDKLGAVDTAITQSNGFFEVWLTHSPYRPRLLLRVERPGYRPFEQRFVAGDTSAIPRPIVLTLRDSVGSTDASFISTPVEGIYSNVAYIEEAGDVVGTEVIIRRQARDYMVSFRNSEGVPGRRFIVPLTVRGNEIRFTIPPDTGILVRGGVQRTGEVEPARRFSGRVSAWGLTGAVEGWVDSLRLPRKPKAYFPDSSPPR
jgi:hypothetical protein